MVSFRNSSHSDSDRDFPSEILLPAHFFFTKVLDLPPGLEEKEIASFIEISLEELSPFPLNQIFYGTYRPGNSQRVLLFAAYRKRFPAGNTEQWGKARWVAPDFISLLGADSSQARILFLIGADSLTGIHFDGKDPVPVQVATRHIGTDADTAKVENEKEIILKRLQNGASSLPPAHTLQHPRVSASHKGKIYFAHDPFPGEKPPATDFSLNRALVASLDVRDKAFLQEKAAADRKDILVWRAFASLSLLLILLLVAEGGLFAFNSHLANQQQLAEEQTEVVAKIEEQTDLAHRLEELGESQLLPFEMLAILNELRPRSIHFTRTQTVELNGLQVEAATENTGDVNNYETALMNSGKFERVEIHNQNLRDGRTTFTLVTTFQNGALREFASGASSRETEAAPATPGTPVQDTAMEAHLRSAESARR
ncbi:MAG: hypothetical protein WD490_10460 [Opitutales bacterium]